MIVYFCFSSTSISLMTSNCLCREAIFPEQLPCSFSNSWQLSFNPLFWFRMSSTAFDRQDRTLVSWSQALTIYYPLKVSSWRYSPLSHLFFATRSLHGNFCGCTCSCRRVESQVKKVCLWLKSWKREARWAQTLSILGSSYQYLWSLALSLARSTLNLMISSASVESRRDSVCIIKNRTKSVL